MQGPVMMRIHLFSILFGISVLKEAMLIWTTDLLFFLKGKNYYSEMVIFFCYLFQVAFIQVMILMPRVWFDLQKGHCEGSFVEAFHVYCVIVFWSQIWQKRRYKVLESMVLQRRTWSAGFAFASLNSQKGENQSCQNHWKRYSLISDRYDMYSEREVTIWLLSLPCITINF